MKSNMKRILSLIALVCMTLTAVAQNNPFGDKTDIAEVGQDDYQYTVFTYKAPDGTFGYYMSVGREFDLLQIFSDNGNSSFSLVDEACLEMGQTMDDAYAFIDTLLTLLEAAPGSTAEFPCRISTSIDQMFVPSTARAVVVKRLLQAKRLCFTFVSGKHTADVDVTKSALKSLRWSMDVHQKLHPNE